METLERAELDGAAATPEQLADVTSRYGHFTAMQVRDGATRGLVLHLQRLGAANRERFGAGLDPDRIRTLVRHALGDERDASVRVHLYEGNGDPRVVVTVRSPGEVSSPQRLRSVPYSRPEPQIKHIVTEQGRFREQVQRDRYDDALLTTSDGLVTETSMANIGFLEPAGVVWPEAPMLRGVTMQLLDERLPAAGVTVRRTPIRVADVESFDGAFVCNARGIAAVSGVDGTVFEISSDRMKLLDDAYASVPWDPI